MAGLPPNKVHRSILQWLIAHPGSTYREGAAHFGAHGGNVAAAKNAVRRRVQAIRVPPAGPAAMAQPDFLDDLFKRSAAVGAGYLLGVHACGRDLADGVVDELLKQAGDELCRRESETGEPVSSMEYKLNMFKDLIRRLRNKYTGTAEKTASCDPTAAGLDKLAQAMQGMDVGSLADKYLYKPVLGESGPGRTAALLADLGSYMIPYVGPTRAGWDAGTDYVNMFGKNLSLGQRAKYMASGLGNTVWAGMGLFGDTLAPGLGSVTTGAIGKGVRGLLKWLPGGKKAIKGISHGIKAVDKSLIPRHFALRGALAAKARGGNRAAQAAQYMFRAKPNPMAHEQGIFSYARNKLPHWLGGKLSPEAILGSLKHPMYPAMSAGRAGLNTMRGMAHSWPPNLAMLGGTMMRPTPGGGFNVPPPPPELNPLYYGAYNPAHYGGNRQMRSAIRS